MEVAVCRGVEGAGDGKGHAEARGGRGGGRAGRVGERGAVRGEVRAAELDRGVRTLRHEVQRDPDDAAMAGTCFSAFQSAVLTVEERGAFMARDSSRFGNPWQPVAVYASCAERADA